MENKKNYSVAIDGPSGAGKSTLARSAARELGILYVDTGAIYRTAALFVRSRGADPDSEAEAAAILPDLKISIGYGADGLQRMYLDGEDVSDAIRLPEVSMLASRVSSLPAVRAFLLEMQRSLAKEQSVIMDGRDIGTVVLPDADVKIFSPPARRSGPGGGSLSWKSAARPRTTMSCCGRSRSGTITTPTGRRRPCASRRTG